MSTFQQISTDSVKPTVFLQTDMDLLEPAVSTAVCPEERLILCCARSQVNGGQADQVKTLLQGAIDWDCVLQTAEVHGVTPLLYWNLNHICPDAVPPETLSQLRSSFHANVQNNLLLMGELFELLNLLEENGISAVPFKGCVLATVAYGNLSLRKFSDLDILVREKDFTKAKNVLLANGYKSRLTDDKESIWLEYALQASLIRKDGGVPIDLHMGIPPRRFFRQFPSKLLWRRLKPLSLAGRTILTFSVEDSLVTLCMNATKEPWKQSLKQICDVAEWVRSHPTIDWNQVLKQAKALGSERLLLLGLLLAHNLLELALPDRILQKIQSVPIISALAEQLQGQLFHEADSPTKDQKFYRLGRINTYGLKTIDQLPDKALYFLHYAIAPSEADQALLSLPPSVSFIYYLLRPFRLMMKFGSFWQKRF